MSTSLESFPEELLDRIVGYVQSPWHLAPLVRVSKRFNRIALPHLYAYVSREGGPPWEECSKQIRPFAFLMLQRPDLAALVQSFVLRKTDWDLWAKDDECGGPDDWPEHPDLDQILKDAIKNHTEDKELQQNWFKTVREGHNDPAILALLLPALVNLRWMDVPFGLKYDSDDAESEYLFQMLLRAAEGRVFVNGLPTFSNLTDVIIPATGDKYPNDPQWFAACIGLPAIKRIYGQNQGDVDGSGDSDPATQVLSKLQPYSSSVEYIELRFSKPSIANFAYLLRAPKCLKVMIYEIGNTWAWTDVKTTAIQSALESQRHNLEKLSLGHMEDYFSYLTEDDTMHEMKPMSFSAFTSLKHLRIAPIFLYGQEMLEQGDARNGDITLQGSLVESTKAILVNALPSQLETLGLMQCEDESELDMIVISIQEVLAQKVHFESLREITIQGMAADILKNKLEVLGDLPWKDVRLLVKIEEKVDVREQEYNSKPWGWEGEVQWNGFAGFDDYTRVEEVLYDSHSLE